MVDPSAASGEMPLVYAAADGEGDSGGAGGSGSGGTSKTSARALLAQHKVQIPDDLTKLQPIPTRRTKSGWVGVYPARKGRWQAQVNHRSIGGYATAWEAGVAVAAHADCRSSSACCQTGTCFKGALHVSGTRQAPGGRRQVAGPGDRRQVVMHAQVSANRSS